MVWRKRQVMRTNNWETCLYSDNVCTHFGAALRGRARALGLCWNTGAAPEVMLELGLERWIGSGRCPGKGQGEERRHSQKVYLESRAFLGICRVTQCGWNMGV